MTLGQGVEPGHGGVNDSGHPHTLGVRYVKALIIHDFYVISFKIISIRIVNIVNVQSNVIIKIGCPFYCI